MSSQQKEYLWVSLVILFYIITSYFGVYDISQIILWPVFAIPMGLLLIKTGKKEVVGLIGVMLSVIISFISTGTLHPVIVSTFLLFILAPAFVFGTLYGKNENISRVIISTTVVVFLNIIIFLTFSKLLGVDYLDIYFEGLDIVQNMWNGYLADVNVQELLPEIENVQEIYAQVIGRTILQAKRTYPATLFTVALVTSVVHLLILQVIARIRSWERPAMKDILNIGLSPVSAWVFAGLWLFTIQLSGTDNAWMFAVESMISVLFMMFQIIGFISMIALIMKMGMNKVSRILLLLISVFWLIFNPTLLVIIGCLDSIFNFRKVETLI